MYEGIAVGGSLEGKTLHGATMCFVYPLRRVLNPGAHPMDWEWDEASTERYRWVEYNHMGHHGVFWLHESLPETMDVFGYLLERLKLCCQT